MAAAGVFLIGDATLKTFLCVCVSFLALASLGQVTIDAKGYTPAQVSTIIGLKTLAFGRSANRLIAPARAARFKLHPEWANVPFMLPIRVQVLHPATPAEVAERPATSRAPLGLTLVFDTSGSYIFSAAYQQLLMSVFTTAQPTINAVFGSPATPGLTVHVRNYDAVIGDRQAVAGGYFVSNNGAGQAEIRFPVYNSNEAAAVDFLHCLLLAYQSTDSYGYDAFNEGLARASVMKIARTPGAMPATLDSSAVENVLEADYDVLGYYDWYNQRALGGPVFIAPNLINLSLPESGSVGGVYLLRYLMAGSAWAKVLVQYPGFASAFNQAFYADPALASNVPGLVALGQTTINTLAGSGNATIEGFSFSDWFNRQFILETHLTYGNKLLVQPVPITGNLGSGDFGVFLIQANYFSTAANGSETLAGGTSYPIYWDNSFNRESPATDTAQIPIAAAYGSVTPNFLDEYGGMPYRVTVDTPVGDQLSRVNLPAGAIATDANPTPNDCFGTIEGAPLQTGQTLSVLVSYTGGTQVTIPVSNGAFGATIGTAAWLAPTEAQFKVIETSSGVPSTLLTRTVDKSVGALAVDLRVGGESTYAATLPAGVSAFGLPIDPFGSYAPALVSQPAAGLLMARYDQSAGAYDYYPMVEAPTIGHGYFVRLPSSQPISIQGRVCSQFPVSVALEPGWNLISSPFDFNIPFSQVQVVVAANDPESYASALGADVGNDIFTYLPGPVDSASGVSETGTMTADTQFAAGKAYFVQCLDSTGAVLTFYPSTQISSFLRSLSANSAQPEGKGWQVRLELTDGHRTVPVYLGVNTAAKAGLDLHYSSAIAPAWGGFQTESIRGVHLYRDIRQDTGAIQTYTVELDGLNVGKSYQLLFPVTQGVVTTEEVRDGTRSLRLHGNTPYSFIATTTAKSVQILLGGTAQ